MLNKLKSYDKATQKLMIQATNYDIKVTGNFSLPEMVFLLRESYKQKLTFRKVFNMLPPTHRNDPSTGFCIVSSYYIYEHTGGDTIWDIVGTPVHWWLRHKQTGTIFDVTYTQFNHPFPYEMGVIEQRIKNDKEFTKSLAACAQRLGKCAGME